VSRQKIPFYATISRKWIQNLKKLELWLGVWYNKDIKFHFEKNFEDEKT
jgi:hypothetical protein